MFEQKQHLQKRRRTDQIDSMVLISQAETDFMTFGFSGQTAGIPKGKKLAKELPNLHSDYFRRRSGAVDHVGFEYHLNVF